MFTIVLFEGDVCEGVPSSWIAKTCESTFCFWPSRCPSYKISKMIKRNQSPSVSWKMRSCMIKSMAKTYEEMLVERKRVQIETSVSSSDTVDSDDENTTAAYHNSNQHHASHDSHPPTFHSEYQIPHPTAPSLSSETSG